MVFKFTNNIDLESANFKRRIKKKISFKNKVVFVNGFSASGKTMLAPIISSMENVESLIYPYEIEWISSFLYAGKIDKLSYQDFVKQFSDHTIYNQMMGRNSNFRPSDISSIFQTRKKLKYLKRIFQKGDNLIPKKIQDENPILNFTSSHLIFFINELAEAFGNRLLFIETFRDPIYMFRQIKILYKDVYLKNPQKIFTFQTDQDGFSSFFFDFFSKDEIFKEVNQKNLNRFIVDYLERIFTFYFNFDFSKITMNKGKIIFLPFEKFVLDPNDWINEITSFLNINKTQSLYNELKKQRVPRKNLHEGFTREVYRRYGNNKSGKKYKTSEEANLDYKNQIKLEFDRLIDGNLYERLENLSNKYNEWINIFDKKNSFS